MLGIVIDQKKTIAGIFDFEAPARVLKFGRGFGTFLEWNTELGCQCDDPNGVLDIVLTRNIQSSFTQLLTLAENRKDRSEFLQRNILRAIIRVFAEAVGKRAVGLANTGCDRVVGAEKNFAGGLAN